MNPKKIALVGFRLSGGGGDRVMATLSNYFSEYGLEVHIIIVKNELGFPCSGTIVNLGKLKNNANDVFNKLKRYNYLKHYLKLHQFDFIIDFRFRIKPFQDLIIAKCLYNTKTIFTVHSSKLDTYMPDFSPLTRLIYANSYAIVSITKAVQHMIEEKHRLKNVEHIFNPIDIEAIEKDYREAIDIDFDYIIAAGRFDTDVKQFDKLIKMYAQSILPQKEIRLLIMGSGTLVEALKAEAKSQKVENLVHLIGFKANPYKYLGKAKFFALTSKYEGLPLVMLEALACGTPVIAFDCLTGPKEIVNHNDNGLLIENQNMDAFIEGMNTLVEDELLYNRCKENARTSIEKFSLETIGKQWLNLLQRDA